MLSIHICFPCKISLATLLHLFPHLDFKILIQIRKFPISVDFASLHQFALNFGNGLFKGIICFRVIYICVAVPTLPWNRAQTLLISTLGFGH